MIDDGIASGELHDCDSGRLADRRSRSSTATACASLTGDPRMPLERARQEIWAALAGELGAARAPAGRPGGLTASRRRRRWRRSRGGSAAASSAAAVPAISPASSAASTRRLRGAQMHGDRVALLVLRRVAVVGHVGADQRAGRQAHAHVLVEAEVDDLLDHAGNAVLAGRRRAARAARTRGGSSRAPSPLTSQPALAAQREVAERQRRVAVAVGRAVTGTRFAAPRKFATNAVSGSS